jgi:hypothetical protein
MAARTTLKSLFTADTKVKLHIRSPINQLNLSLLSHPQNNDMMHIHFVIGNQHLHFVIGNQKAFEK